MHRTIGAQRARDQMGRDRQGRPKNKRDQRGIRSLSQSCVKSLQTKFEVQHNPAIQRGRGNGMELHSTRFSPFRWNAGANIKSMKRILLSVAKLAIMNFEELTTFVTQIEAVLNSRPLPPLSSTPNDFNTLTPGHFLTNCAISSFPEPYTASDFLSYHSMWKLIQSLRNKFWSRWSTE
ncbi:integrase catalytic domain-containing protein [Trichonephila clavipes]|nr:integrase catalytic domain-containing protein [Trichonephila clavipes]